MGIWVVDTLNQSFIGGSYTEIYFKKNKWQKQLNGKNPFSQKDQFSTPNPICLNISFCMVIFMAFVWKCCAFNRSTFK